MFVWVFGLYYYYICEYQWIFSVLAVIDSMYKLGFLIYSTVMSLLLSSSPRDN